jgi:selenocysteine lyase/cysteine desulfurase
MVGVTAEEVAFIKNTSEGISIVAAGFPWKQGDNVVTTNMEFPSNVYPWMRLRSRGVELRMVPGRDGRMRAEDLFAACDGKTRLLSLSSVEFANGFRHDLPRIGEYCRRNGIFFFVDAIQSLGAIPLDARAFGIDALAADGHKWLLAPEGIGAMYISRDVMEMIEPVILGWHSVANRFDFEAYDFRLSPDARRYEPGSFNTVGLAAFDASLGLLLEVGVDRIWERVRRLTDRVFDEASRAGYEVLSSRVPEERSGIVTFRVAGADAGALWRAMQDRGVVCSPRLGGIRLSPHFYNTEEEIAEAFAVVRDLVEAGAAKGGGAGP